ncbi:MAG: hypothetical protein NWF06_08000 [Candidatus Bathyarchaeota archaeon]|nr:hypothetical protein [Candidatus Bathyarchaeum sp.]
MELKREKKTESINMEEFKALVNNLIPTTLKQAEWICNEVEKLTNEHPELKTKFKEWYAIPESEKRALEEIIKTIIAEADKARQKW